MWRPWETSQSTCLNFSLIDSPTSKPTTLGNSQTSSLLNISPDIPVFNRFSMFMEPDYQEVEENVEEDSNQVLRQPHVAIHKVKQSTAGGKNKISAYDASRRNVSTPSAGGKYKTVAEKSRRNVSTPTDEKDILPTEIGGHDQELVYPIPFSVPEPGKDVPASSPAYIRAIVDNMKAAGLGQVKTVPLPHLLPMISIKGGKNHVQLIVLHCP